MLELKKVSKKFAEKVVLDEFDFQFVTGKTYALVGVSGSGKTTLLNILGKLEKVDSGEVFFNDNNFNKIKEQNFFRNSVGYLFQNYGLIDNETVEENLDLAFVGRKVKKSDKKQLMSEVLKKVNLNIELSRKIFSLSGGEAQRVAIAKIILKDPPLILADEPTASLDEINSQEIIRLLTGLANKKRIIVVATHNKNIWEKLDEVISLDQ